MATLAVKALSTNVVPAPLGPAPAREGPRARRSAEVSSPPPTWLHQSARDYFARVVESQKSASADPEARESWSQLPVDRFFARMVAGERRLNRSGRECSPKEALVQVSAAFSGFVWE